MILLNGKERRDVLTYDCAEEFDLALDNIKAGTKAQAKKIYEWGDEDCEKHPYTSRSKGEAYNRKRHRCPECWQELLKELV